MSSTDHPIAIAPFKGLVRVTIDNETVVETREALALSEADYPVVYYVPKSAIRSGLLGRSDHTSHCPYKGDAAYFHLRRPGGTLAENAVQTYREPLPGVTAIAGYLAFWAERVSGLAVRAIAD